MGCLRFIIGALIFLVIVPLIMAFEVLTAVNATVLNRDFYVQAVNDPALFDVVFEEMGLSAAGAQGQNNPLLEAILSDLNTADNLRAQAVSVVDQIFNLMEGRTDVITFQLNLTGIRDTLQSSTDGEQFYLGILSNLETCPPGRQPFEALTGDAQSPLPLCMPQGMDAAQFANEFDRVQLAAAMPDQYVMVVPVELSPEDRQSLREAAELRENATQVLIIAGLAVFSIWFASAFIVSRTRGARFRWLGFTLFFASVWVALVGLIFASQFLPEFASEIYASTPVSDQVSMALADAVVKGLSGVGTAFLLAGGIPTAIALVLMVIGATASNERPDSDDDYRVGQTVYVGKPKRQDDDPWAR